MNFRQTDVSGGRLSSAEMHDEDTIFHPQGGKQVIGDDCHDFRENFLNVDSARWGEQFSDLPVENGVKLGVEFDRYEPTQGYDDQNDENHHVKYSSSSTLRKSQENTRGDHIKKGNPHQSKTLKHKGLCYSCGGWGHKMCNCPQKNSSHRNFSMFDHGLDGEIDRRVSDEGKLERCRSSSRENLHSSGENSSIKRINPDIKLSPGKHQRSISGGRSPVAKEADRCWRKDSSGNK
uniref:Serine/arginine-rich splicing factor 4-like n=1 Tax=Rhizophora mucronata TaxID=61149 RepID=A0A2P2IZ20_RHIMU